MAVNGAGGWRVLAAAIAAAVLSVVAAPAWGGIPPVDGAVVRPFDPPASRYGTGHRGVDLAASGGEPVRAALAGVVTFAGLVAGEGWVTIDHGDGLRTTYGVLGERLVVPGQRVMAGEALGFLSEGRDHVDWGARRGDAYVEPLALLTHREARLIDPSRFSRSPPPEPTGSAAALIWPVQGRISSHHGPRVHPVTGERRFHAGIDLAAASGTAVAAAADGTVSFTGSRGGYGLMVVVDHRGGLQTRYAHVSWIGVRTGQRVPQGQVLARVGSTGLATGPHLHFEVRLGGQTRDPLDFLPG